MDKVILEAIKKQTTMNINNIITVIECMDKIKKIKKALELRLTAIKVLIII